MPKPLRFAPLHASRQAHLFGEELRFAGVHYALDDLRFQDGRPAHSDQRAELQSGRAGLQQGELGVQGLEGGYRFDPATST